MINLPPSVPPSSLLPFLPPPFPSSLPPSIPSHYLVSHEGRPAEALGLTQVHDTGDEGVAHVALALVQRVEVELVALRVASTVRPPLRSEGREGAGRVEKKMGIGVFGEGKEMALDNGLDGCAGGPCWCRCH